MPVGADQIWMAAADPRGRRRGHPARQAAAELGRLDHRQELGQQSRAGHAGHPLPPVGAGRDRREAAPQGRRLRELQRAVLGAVRTAAPRPRRPQPRGRAQVHPARRLAGAGQGLQPGRRRRLHRRRPRHRLRAREAAAVPDARRRESRSGAGRARSHDHADGQRARHRRDGIRRHDDAHRLQDRRAQPAAGELLRVGRLRLLGVPAARRGARRQGRVDHEVAVPRPVAPDRADARPGRLRAHRPRSRADRADLRGADPRAEGRRRGAAERPDVHRPRLGARVPDEARRAGRPERRRCSTTAAPWS